MGRQLILDLLARDKTGPASRSAAKNLDDIGDAAKDAAKSTEKLGDSSDRAEDQVERLGKSGRTAAQHVEHLDHEIELCERELHQLAIAFAEAKTAADRADLSKGIRATQRELAQLNKNKGILSKLIPDKGDGQKAGQDLAAGITDGLKSSFKPGPVLGVAAAAAAPFIGAAISAAVIGGAGVGGVIGGVLLAAKDPRIKAAGAELGKNLLGQLQRDAEPFIDPVLQNIGKIEARFVKMNDRIKQIFSKSSGFLGPLVDGALDGVDGILRGFDALVRRGRPVIDALGRSFTIIGDSVGDALEVISGGSEDAASALEDVARTVGAVVEATGYLIRGLTEAYGAMSYLHRQVGEFERQLVGWDDGARIATTTSGVFAAAQKAAAKKVNETTAGVRDQIDALSDLANRLRGETDPIFGMLNAQDDLRDAQKGVNQAIKDHGKNSPEYEAALRKQAEAALALEAAAGKVATTSSGKLGPALRATLEQAGFTKAEIANLERQFKTAKAAGDAFAGDYRARLIADTENAIASMKRAKKLYDQFRSKKITVSVYVAQTRANKVATQLGEGAYRAGGGPVKKGNAYVVGDGGRPEVFVPDRDGKIIPSISQYAAGASMGGGGGWTLTVDGRNADSVMATAILKLLRVNPSFAAEVGRLVGAR